MGRVTPGQAAPAKVSAVTAAGDGVILAPVTNTMVPIGPDDGVQVRARVPTAKTVLAIVPAAVATTTGLLPGAALFGTLMLAFQLPEASTVIGVVFHAVPAKVMPPAKMVSAARK